MKFFKTLRNILTNDETARQCAEYNYLAKSVDLFDLERRQRLIQQGKVTFL